MNEVRVSMHRTADNEFVSVPVNYLIEQENENVVIYRCNVGLTADEMPEWITPSFNIRKVYRKPITCTSTRPVERWNSVDAFLLADQAMQNIRVKETYKRQN